MVDVNRAKAKLAELNERSYEGSGNDFSFMKLEDGVNVIRIIPAVDRGDFWIEREQSYKVGKNSRMVINRRQFGKPCPLMEHIDALYAKGDEVSKKEADALWPSRRVIFWVIDRLQDEKNKKKAANDQELIAPKLLTTNQTILKGILAIVADPEYGDIDDPIKGVDLKIIVTPREGQWPSYQVLPSRAASPLGTPEQIAEWTKEDLFKKYKVGEPHEEEYIRKVLAGTDKDTPTTAPQQAQPQSVSSVASRTASAPAAPVTSPPIPGEVLTATYYVCLDGKNTIQMTGEAIDKAIVFDGHEPSKVLVHNGKEWITAASLGFTKRVAPPPAPNAPPPPSMPPPPGMASTTDSEEAALEAKLAALRNKKSSVGDDLRSALKR